MKETMQYLNTLPDFVSKKSNSNTNLCTIEQFMKKPQKILQIDITGKYQNKVSAIGSWNKSIARTGFKIRVKYAEHENRKYLFLIKDPDGTATL